MNPLKGGCVTTNAEAKKLFEGFAAEELAHEQNPRKSYRKGCANSDSWLD